MEHNYFPNETSEWAIFYDDLFDREIPSHEELSGIGIIYGIRLLWERTLSESINENGIGTFSRFTLRWGNDHHYQYLSIHVDPFENSGLSKIRQWVTPEIIRQITYILFLLLSASERWNGKKLLSSAESEIIISYAEISSSIQQFSEHLTSLQMSFH